MNLLWGFVSEWTILFGLLLYLAYKWSTSTYDFFEKKNVPFIKPLPLLGNFKGMLFQTESFFDAVKNVYLHFKDKKFYGIFEMRNPLLVIRDPDLIKQITVKDFDYFLNHRVILEPQDEPMFGNSLFSLKDQKWKDMRATLSPAFTGSKMRVMFQLIEETCKTAIDHLKQESHGESLVIEMKQFFTRYTNDVIATSAFGLKINSLEDKDNEFYKMGRKSSSFSGLVAFKFFLFTHFRKWTRFFKLRLFDKKFTAYFQSLVLDTMKYRQEHNIFRPDMINLLMDTRQGKLQPTEKSVLEEKEGFATVEESTIGQRTHNRVWSDDELVSQCFLFFIAGFETTATLMCFCAHELMENPEIQEKLLEEVDAVIEELNGKPLTYEALQKMKYLDMVFSETLRKWPPAIAVDRICTKPYVLNVGTTGEKVQINVGDYLWIPITGIHYDPKYYPDPDKFDPERFSDENKNSINPFTYLPFGVGPRNCIGSRFALMESKAILFHILRQFKMEISPKTKMPIELSPSGFQLDHKPGFWMKLSPRTYFGVFEMRTPILVINDPELITQVAVKDFDHFLNHRINLEPEREPLFANGLFSLRDEKWKDMRCTLSPAFTGSKMRMMFQHIEETCHKAVDHLKKEAKKGPLILNMKDFLTRYTNDVIAKAVFGLNVNSLEERDNQFYKMGRKLTNFGALLSLKFFLCLNFKKLVDFFQIRLFDKTLTSYFFNLIMDTIKYRTENHIIRPDVINLLMEARRGNLKHTENIDQNKEESFAAVQESSIGKRTHNREWSDDDIVAQCFLFFLGGFDTSSNIMCFAAQEIMGNPEVQQKLLDEIDTVKMELNGEPLTYDALQKMKYLDMVISEVLRKWPAAFFSDRVCNKPYVLNNNNTDEKINIDVGDTIWFPIVGLHYDDKYFTNPDKFDPERFNDENKHNIKPFSYIPFGLGPRNCIGSRFALMEIKAILYHMLSEYNFEFSPKSVYPIVLSASSGFALVPKSGFWIQLKSRY